MPLTITSFCSSYGLQLLQCIIFPSWDAYDCCSSTRYEEQVLKPVSTIPMCMVFLQFSFVSDPKNHL